MSKLRKNLIAQEDADLADALNLSHSSVSGRLKRGREKLKNMLEGRELDE